LRGFRGEDVFFLLPALAPVFKDEAAERIPVTSEPGTEIGQKVAFYEGFRQPSMHQHRTYRKLMYEKDMVSFRVVVKETDLYVHAAEALKDVTKELVLKHRGYIETFIARYPMFSQTMSPWRIGGPLPAIIRDMIDAGDKAGVGPMAAVAGAIAERVGIDLLSYSDDVIIENGGDVFLKTRGPVTIGVFAGSSPLSLRIGLRLDTTESPLSVCTSSGTVGHSTSFGKADAVSVVAASCSLADAAATAICNRIKHQEHIQSAIDFGKEIEGVMGIIAIIHDAVGMWGELDIVPLEIEKG
jgi:ApbE superfamily uncharacterized protein (UPF0280 family)